MIYDWQMGPHDYFGNSFEWGFPSGAGAGGTSINLILLGAG